MNPCIIIPTYNECENLPTLVRIIKYINHSLPVVIVDDNSPDGTGKIADQLSEQYGSVYVIHRKEKVGIGAAIINGFKFALGKNFDPIITMDGDLSHSPFYLKKFLKYSQDYDLLIGSRYIRGLRVEGWRFRNVLISKLANMFVSYIMVKPIWDFTSGYRVYSASFLRQLNLDGIPSQGYLFQIHMIHLAYKLRLRVKEIAFVFKDVEYPLSKISKKDRWITFRSVFGYRAPFLEILRHLTFLAKDYRRFVEEYEELLNPPPLKNGGKYTLTDNLMVSVGVMAYNEEKNIAKCLAALENQNLSSGEIAEIYVVSSGSTDRTNEIVFSFHKRNPCIKLVVQRERKGKASAINEYLRIAQGDICILESADTITEPDTVENLIKPFSKSRIGMTGAHSIPVNHNRNFIGFCVNKLWRLHHLMALDHAKCGEMIAFRNIISKIPSYSSVDEAVIEAIICENGLQIEYVPEAVVHNKGPENLRDFLKQRRRIATGHKHLLSTKGYRVATSPSSSIIKYVWKDMSWTPRQILFTFGLILTEALSRLAGVLNFYLRDKNPYIWEISSSTKHIVERIHARS
ncbi:MAG: glycosyltransferase [Calditrichia bacterium]